MIHSVATFKAAAQADVTVMQAWAKHYEATASDAKSNTVKVIVDAWKAARLSPASAAMVGSMTQAHELTKTGRYESAYQSVFGENEFKAAHKLVEAVRKAHDKGYVQAIIDKMNSAIEAAGADADAYGKAVVKAIRELKAGSTTKAAKTPNTVAETGEGEGGEGDTVGTDSPAAPSDANAQADAVIAILRGMLKSDAPDATRQRTVIELMKSLNANWAADAASKVA